MPDDPCATAACDGDHTDRDLLWLLAVGIAFLVGFAAAVAVWAL